MVSRELGLYAAPSRYEEGQRLGPPRHARQRLGVGGRLVRYLPQRGATRSLRSSYRDGPRAAGGLLRRLVQGLALREPELELARVPEPVHRRLSLCAWSPPPALTLP